MITTSRIQKIGRRLTFPCPFCGGVVFSLSCRKIDYLNQLTNSRFCFTINFDNKPPFSRHCHIFCSFICNKRNIPIDSDTFIPYFLSGDHRNCSLTNKMYDKLFESFSQKIQGLLKVSYYIH